MLRGSSWGTTAAVVATILLVSGVVGGGVQLGDGGAAVSGVVDTASAEQSGDVRVENPARDNVDGDGNTGADETGDGDDVYGSIRAGVGNASDTSRVEVAPGTYRERGVSIAKNVTVVATGGPDRTTLNGSQFPLTPAFDIEGVAAPVVAGFSFADYGTAVNATGSGNWTIRDSVFRDNEYFGVNAFGSAGAWTVRDSTFKYNQESGVQASRSSGAWTVRDSTFRDTEDGVDAFGSAGNWSVRDSTFRYNEHGVRASNSSGGWSVRESTFRENRYAGVRTSHSSGNWSARDSTFRNNLYFGVEAFNSSGAWTVRDSTFRNNGIQAIDSSGAWTVRNSTFGSNEHGGITADGSSGDWSVRESTFENNSAGVDAFGSSGAWTIRNTTFRDNGLGVSALETSGAWEVHRSTIVDSEGSGISAVYAAPAGTATRNYWGQASGPTTDQCVGNVTCRPGLSEPPGSSLDGAAAAYDTDDDGAISIGELAGAATDFAGDELSITELSQVALAFART